MRGYLTSTARPSPGPRCGNGGASLQVGCRAPARSRRVRGAGVTATDWPNVRAKGSVASLTGGCMADPPVGCKIGQCLADTLVRRASPRTRGRLVSGTTALESET